MDEWTCAWCGAENEAGAPACSTCGEAELIQQRSTPPLLCCFALGRGAYCTERYPHQH